MPGLMIMVPIAIGLALSFLGFYFWSIRNGDIEDAEMNKHRFLLDDEDDVDRSFAPSEQQNNADRASLALNKIEK